VGTHSKQGRVWRFDVAGARITPTGGQRWRGNIARTGVQEYRRADGSVRKEYRPKEEVEKSLTSLAAAAVTIGHPREGDVTPENWGQLSVGTVWSDGELVRVDGDPHDWVTASVLLQRRDALEFAASGDVELSGGYWLHVDETPGVSPEGEAYDAVQRDISYNHVAMLREHQARAGRHARLRADGSSEPIEQNDSGGTPAKDAKMKIVLDGIEYDEGSPSHISALTAALKRADAESAALTARADQAEAALKAAQTELETMQKNRDALVEARGTLVSQARQILGPEYSPVGRTDSEIRRDALAKLKPAARFDGKSDQWIEAYFQASLDAMPATSAVPAPAATDFNPRQDAMHTPQQPQISPEELQALKVEQARLDSYN
jgi:hypothetical protein